MVRKIFENDGYEFYLGGTHNDAAKVKKELKEEHGKDGALILHGTYGWVVRVNK